MAQLTSLKCKGLFTHPNELGTVPDGAMLIAKNCVIDREDIIENRRGSKRFGPVLANYPETLMTYKNRVLVHHGTTLSYDSDGAGTWSNYSGSFSAQTGRKMRSFEANQNFYFLTSAGVKKLDSLTETPVSAGIPRALDGTATLGSDGSGWFAVDNQVAYRIVWGIEDANENLILGAPSERILVTNPTAGAADNVDLVFTIPEGITVNHIYQVYRSAQSGQDDVEPNDELQLAYEGNPTSGQITAKSVTLTDVTADSLLGATLYTSPSQEGIALANDEPPAAKDVAVFRGHALYGNTVTNHSLTLTLIGVGGTSLFYFTPTANTTNGSNQLTTVSSTSGLAVGQLITGTGIPANTKVTVVGSGTVTMDKNATADGTGIPITFRDGLTIDATTYWANSSESISDKYFKAFSAGTVADNIEDTAKSICKVINQNTVNIYGYYLSGYEDLPGKMWIRDRAAGGALWYANSTKGSAFSPTLTNAGTDVYSSNEAKKNRLYVSKEDEPEAIPLAQYFDVGSADKELYRVIALRDAAFILKEDGIWRFTGTNISDFQVSLLDNTAILIGVETAVALNNQVYAYTTQGVVAISDTGVQVVSRPVEVDLAELSSDQYPDFKTIAFAVAYETERKYLLFVPTETGDTYPTQAYVYNTFTNAWTTWVMNVEFALVNSYDDRIYYARADEKYVAQARKEFVVTDYADDEYSVTLVDYTGTAIEVSSTTNAVAGQTLYQGTDSQAIVESITDATHLVVDRETDWTRAGSAKLYDPIPIEIQWVPAHGGNPGLLKQFSEAVFFFKQAVFAMIKVVFGTNFAKTGVDTFIEPKYGNNFGDGSFGDGDFGGDVPEVQPIRTYVPLEQQRGHWLNVSIEHEEACTQFALSGVGLVMNPMETRFH